MKNYTICSGDRLSKYAYFIPISDPDTVTMIAQVFFDHIFKLHGMHQSIVCDWDPTFTSVFWKELFKLQGINSNFNSSYHPQTMGRPRSYTAPSKCTYVLSLVQNPKNGPSSSLGPSIDIILASTPLFNPLHLILFVGDHHQPFSS